MWLLLAVVVAATPSSSAAAGAPKRDSDGDGISDEDEDTNHNGVVDPGESDPNNPDSDHDNVPDAVERKLGTDPTQAGDVPPIPEPLLVDLVRNLGSGRNELEINLVGSTTGFDSLRWGPEIEYTPAKNLGVELELPFRNGRLEVVKGAAQYTLGSIDTRRLEFGVLGSYQHATGAGGGTERQVFLGAVSGVRISHTVQALTIVGPTMDFARTTPAFGGLLSPSIFYQPSRRFTTGIELGYQFRRVRSTIGEEELGIFTVMPQVHINPIANIKVQLGAGMSAALGRVVQPLLAMRVSYEL